MPVLSRCAIMLAVTAMASFATTITFTNPFFGQPGHTVGDPLIFDIEDVKLTQPTTPGGLWTLQVDTNYGTQLPGANEVVPSFMDGLLTFFMSDVLIQQRNNFYGIILHSHDGYIAGDLYSAAGFQNATQFTTNPVLLDTGGTLLGTGTETAQQNGTTRTPGFGTTFSEFTVTVTFHAPADFLSGGDFTLDASSATCGNGFLTGRVPPVPEPGTWALMASALVLIGLGAMRRKVRT
jgi:hypothetical protein